MSNDGPVLSEYITVYVVLLLSAETNPQDGYGYIGSHFRSVSQDPYVPFEITWVLPRSILCVT
jgi:hypothetical protein